MKINNILIENFRCYYKENEVKFNSSGKITLIYGDSGYGKSSFLQFFRWIFYNDPDFGKDNDKPLFNTVAYEEKEPGETIDVRGVVEFDHLGTKYSLEKKHTYSVTLNPNNAKLEATDYNLQYMEDDNWVDYDGDVSKKINSIMPKGLSKYFLLDGEKARDIVLNSTDLRLAIHSLFGIDEYEKSIEHIGSAYDKKTVIGYYSNLMTSQIKAVSGLSVKLTPQEYQDSLQDLNEEIKNLKRLRSDLISNINEDNARRDQILKDLGEASNKDNIEEIIRRNDEQIKRLDDENKKITKQIGDLFYQCFPYLIMTGVTSRSASILREKRDDFSVNYHTMFNNLKKELLKEVLERNSCICGRDLDKNSIKYINDTISIMPPDSYIYLFGQFVKKTKSEIQASNLKIYGYDNIVSSIAENQKKIAEFETDNKERYAAIKRLDEAKDLVDELEAIDKRIKESNTNKTRFDGDIAKKTQTFNIAEQQLEKIIKNSEVSDKYSSIISFFKDVKKDLEEEKKKREADVADVLNNCVKEIFKQLTTQSDLNADNIQFVNKNFSLRTTYLTGGQLAIDVYSYVIGIIKALQQFGMDNNENPIIIDAPFAFTGNEQSEHIFRTLPSVVKQTVLLTLDLNKIKSLLGETKLYEFYVIKNESQEKAIIERGNINEFKF